MTRRHAQAPEGRPLQWSDIDREGREVVNTLMRGWGKAKSRIPEVRAQHIAARNAAESRMGGPDHDVAVRTYAKADRALGALDKIAPVVKDRAVSIPAAATARTDLVRRSVERVRSEPELAGTSPLRAAGAGWYYNHHARLAGVSESTGVDKSRVIAASAVMSPLNSPDNEYSAVSALAKLHSENPTITLTPHARKALGSRRASVQFSELTDAQVAKLGTASLRSHISGVDQSTLIGLANGGTKKNVRTAAGVIRGSIDPSKAISPHKSAKVWSYHDSIVHSVPGTPEHEEYLTRAQTAMYEMPGQQTMDLYGLRGSREGALSPTKTTAEDTWQNAISSRQPLEGIPNGRHLVSPAKFVGSDKAMTDTGKKHGGVSAHPSGDITQEGLRHAWNNEATIRSARQLSKGTDVEVPSVVPQEVAWTEARRVAGKDPSYQPASRMEHFNKGQGRLF